MERTWAPDVVGTVFCVLDKTRPLADTKGPIVSIHGSKRAADKVADPKKHAVVEVRNYRDRPDTRADCVVQTPATPRWRGTNT